MTDEQAPTPPDETPWTEIVGRIVHPWKDTTTPLRIPRALEHDEIKQRMDLGLSPSDDDLTLVEAKQDDAERRATVADHRKHRDR